MITFLPFREFAMAQKYFFIRQELSMRVLDATDNGEVVMWEIHGGDSQMWYWAGDVLKNKAHPDKVKNFIEKI